MTQPSTDYDVDANPSGVAMRGELNTINLSILTKNSGATEPPETFAGMWWMDTASDPWLLKIRNPDDDGWVTMASIVVASGVTTLLSAGGTVPSLAAEQTFTETQTIDESSEAGQIALGSDLDTGVAARQTYFGHDSGGANTNYATVEVAISDNTDTSEDGEYSVTVLAAGSGVKILTLTGSLATIAGTLTATTLQQGGTPIATLINNAIGLLGINTESGTTLAPAQADQGEGYRFTGSSDLTVTFATRTAGTVYVFKNDGTADILFADGTASVVDGGTTLGQGGTATATYWATDEVTITGDAVCSRRLRSIPPAAPRRRSPMATILISS
jgi:hypothetical protein